MRSAILSIIACIPLAGCASLLEDMQNLNANLHSLNSALRTSGSGTPGIHTVNATVENTCNQAAFEEAFKREYSTAWNSLIRVKENYYRLTVEQNPNDTTAQHNYALYRGRKLEAMKYGTSGYGISSDDPCVVQSYTQGQLAGGRAADRDVGALESQEI